MTVLFDGIAFSPLRQARRSFIETGTSNHRDSGPRDTDGPEQKSVVEEAVMMTKTTVVVPKSEGTVVRTNSEFCFGYLTIIDTD